jgi:cytochrome c-type biogenesis protein CcsB
MQANRRPKDGKALIAMVGLAVAFLLYVAYLSAAASGFRVSEASLLCATLIFYAGAGALYLGFGATGAELCAKFASLATGLGWIANSVAITLRWRDAGHPPFANLHEMLLCSVWTLALLTLIAESKFGVRLIGAITMPLAIAGAVLMQFDRNGAHPLAPLLQSNWLEIHVTLAILAYAACALSFALAILFLIQDKIKTERLLPSAELLDRLTYRTICLAFPLLSLMIATGAYWANQTWGSYWSWDPKETWAAITWLVYALYLHLRITIGWRGRKAAYFAVAGFVVVIFTFFGVTYFMHGQHIFS